MNTINQPIDLSVKEDGAVYTVRAIASWPINSQSVMCICDGNKVINLTKQQAMDFFGLKDPMAVRHNLD